MRPGLRRNHFEIITNRQPRATCRLLLHNRPFVNTQGGDQPCPLLLIALVYPTLPSEGLCIDRHIVECWAECSM